MDGNTPQRDGNPNPRGRPEVPSAHWPQWDNSFRLLSPSSLEVQPGCVANLRDMARPMQGPPCHRREPPLRTSDPAFSLQSLLPLSSVLHPVIRNSLFAPALCIPHSMPH